MILAMKLVGLIYFNVHGFTIDIEPTELNVLIEKPVTALQMKKIVVVDKNVPTFNFLKQLDMYALYLMDPLIHHNYCFLRTESTVSKKKNQCEH